MYRLGIDVGGTNTDAVIMSGRGVIASAKTPTTGDITSGIIAALESVIERAAVAREAITVAMIGTTHFTNALIERRRLDEVAALRLCLPATKCLRPMVDWPADLARCVGNHSYLAHGGYEFDGREITPLDESEIRNIAADVRSKGIKAVAVTSVFSPISMEMEERVEEIFRRTAPNIAVVRSGDIGRIGLLERESAAIINASLLGLAAATVDAFALAFQQSALRCPFYITQNDGTLLSARLARRFPVLTFASGPTNSMRGAAFLSDHKEAIVIDIGGTTTDIGVLHKGFPRQATAAVKVGGVRTNFRMPDISSFGLGGGSLVRESGDGLVIGPQSVGYELKSKALAFGGGTLTLTDIAVALGLAEVGERSKVAHIDLAFAERARQRVEETLINWIERCRTSPESIPVIAVGGGSILAPSKLGDLDVIQPDHFAVANAVGAAIAQVSGEVDRVFALRDGMTREACLEQATREAVDKAIGSGAVPESIELFDKEDVPLAYLPGNATRVRVKVIGDMA